MPPIIAETADGGRGRHPVGVRPGARACRATSSPATSTTRRTRRCGATTTARGADVIGVFLQEKTGYCVHYASAMALMARSLGIPSRIAVGFQPGERSFDQGQTYYTVNSDDLHAWPELFFQGVGWLRFEPTPGRGTVPSYGVEAVDDPTTPENEAAPVPSVTPGAVVPERPIEDLGGVDAGRGGRRQPVRHDLARRADRADRHRASRRWRSAPASGSGGIGRCGRGRMRRRAAWRELRDTAHDYGWSAPETETVRAFEERLAMVLVDDREPLTRLRGSVEASAYGRDAATHDLGRRASRRASRHRADDRDRAAPARRVPAALAGGEGAGGGRLGSTRRPRVVE